MAWHPNVVGEAPQRLVGQNYFGQKVTCYEYMVEARLFVTDAVCREEAPKCPEAPLA